jgi:hypothetical protein
VILRSERVHPSLLGEISSSVVAVVRRKLAALFMAAMSLILALVNGPNSTLLATSSIEKTPLKAFNIDQHCK